MRLLLAALVAYLSLGLAVFAQAARAESQARPQRVVSINACTDQLLWALADRSQIAALSTYAVNPAFFTEADQVRKSGVRLIEGSAEEVLKLKPDLVLAGSYTRRATRNWLQQAGIPLVTFPANESVEAAKASIRETAKLLGQHERGEALVAEIDRASAALREANGGGLRALQLQRRGFTSGTDTLLDDLLQTAGLTNAADQLGITSVRRTSLEAILKLNPDILVMSSDAPAASDQGSALLLHPALAERYPPHRRIIIAENIVVCGGPSLAQALYHMAAQVQVLRRRGIASAVR